MLNDPGDGFFYRIFYHGIIYPLFHALFLIINKIWRKITENRRQIRELFEENERLRQEIKNLSNKVERATLGSNPILKKWVKEQLNLLYEEVKFMLNEEKISELADSKKNDKK
jgi:regulator of replication initiation timing